MPGARPAESIRVAVELVAEGLISEEEAILRIDPGSLDQLLHPTIARSQDMAVLARGMPAAPGAAVGEIAFTSERAQIVANEERPVILVRNETYPEDIHGMHVADGVLTIRGGTTSHAAVVARGLGKPCVTGAGSLRINAETKTLHAAGRVLKEGDPITIDGTSGEVIEGAATLMRPSLTGDFATLMEFADRARRMRVRANAETATDARAARSFGAEGIGLCRTEHMFFEGNQMRAMREMILAADEAGRRAALDKMLPFQRSGFTELFEIMAGLPVMIRLLDPAAARVPAQERGRDRRDGGAARRRGDRHQAPHRGAGGVQPDAGPPRLPARRLLSGDRRDPGAGDLRGRHRGRRDHGRSRGAGDHGAAGQPAKGARLRQGAGRQDRGRP